VQNHGQISNFTSFQWLYQTAQSSRTIRTKTPPLYKRTCHSPKATIFSNETTVNYCFYYQRCFIFNKEQIKTSNLRKCKQTWDHWQPEPDWSSQRHRSCHYIREQEPCEFTSTIRLGSSDWKNCDWGASQCYRESKSLAVHYQRPRQWSQ
jgi:hypothetical protein